MARWCPLLVLAACVHVGPGPLVVTESSLQGVHVTTRIVTYRVEGATVRELRARMARIGPLDDGHHQSAFTWVSFAWSYPFNKTDSSCELGPVDVEMEVTQTFPEWEPPGSASPSAIAEWTRWLAATRAHEDGHAALGKEAALELAAQLPRTRAFATCQEVDDDVNETGRKVLERMRAKHRQFDETTQHGAKTGALLRSDE